MAIINWGDVIGRYPALAKARDATEVNTNYVLYAIAEVEGRLAPMFTVPFSSNNITAKDLAIDTTYAKWYRFNDPAKADAIDDHVNERIEALLSGQAAMMTSDGSIMHSVGGTVWSTTQDYTPVFDKSDPITWMVGSEELLDNADARL